MRRLNTVAALLAASSAMSGCASLGISNSWDEVQHLAWDDVRNNQGAVLVAEQPAPAPAGLVAFCDRMSEACAAGARDNDTASESSLLPAAWTSEPATGGVWIGSPAEDGAAMFARMLAARAEGRSHHYGRHEVSLTETLWRELESVNIQVNRSISAQSDANHYGITEYWAMPLTERASSGAPVQGDCEDYALEKRAQLISLGWDRDALALAVAYAPDVGMHAVLIAQTDRGDFVLDNLHDSPRAPETLNYRWVSRQAGPSMTVWASARIELAPPGSEPGEDMLQASLDLDVGRGDERVALLSTVMKPVS